MGKGLQKIHFTFGEEGLTFLAGFPVIYQFAKSLNLKRFFQRYLNLSHRNTYFHWSDLLLSHFYYTIAGIERLDHLTSMKNNGLIPELTGLPKLPGTRAMRDFILNMTPEDLTQIERVHDIIRQKIFHYPSILTSATLDFDSSVLTVYGNQELAEVGYNPFKHGRKSYHPVFGFESHFRISLNGELRPGKKTNKSEVIPFIETALKKIPSTIATSRTRARADAGFYCWPTIKFLDGNGYGFVIVAQVTNPIKMQLTGLKYRIFNHQLKLAVAEFRYQPHGWKKKYRFVVMRYQLPPKPEISQRTLLKIERYEYHVFVTNLDLSPEHVWYFYRDRAAVETYGIKELKLDFFMSKIPTRKFLANQVHLKLLLLDYDLFRWFQMLCLPEQFQSKTLKWIRRNILVAPGKFTTPGHKNILKFQRNHPNEKLLKQIYRNAQKVRSLLK
jgi:hypothetical protein